MRGLLHIINSLDEASPLGAIVGGLCSDPTEASAVLSSALRIPQISYGAMSHTLSSTRDFPYLMRTAPSSMLEAEAMSDLIRFLVWPAISERENALFLPYLNLCPYRYLQL